MDTAVQISRLFWNPLRRRPSSHLGPLGQGDTASTCPMDSGSIHSRSSSPRICKYDVFLSFRGTDTRNTFVDHLYNHLMSKGIFTFKDDKTLEKGEPISPQLLHAIKDSRISIIVFSKNYADSTWCLEEMATIADCEKELKQTVFPVFYDVDPSFVRKQSGVYKNAFALLTEKFIEVPVNVDRWKRVMTGFADLAGWDVRDKPEFKEIEKIVQEVIKKLNHNFSGHADDLVGIQPRVEELEKLLKLSSEDDDCRVLAIWGMGGIGKTTHATVLYDRISYQFGACCFIENVSQIYKDGGAIDVHKQIIYQTLNEKNLKRYSSFAISKIVKDRLSRIKVLLVLDNVDESEQLAHLAIRPELLGPGSRIIITTRDKDILKVYGVVAFYEVPLLNGNDARELFRRKAFKSDDPSGSCVELMPEVLKYAQGLPLAIGVIGTFLYGRNSTRWRDTLDRLWSDPDERIMKVLQISFEGLQRKEKEIFLHIACFFKGKREDYVMRILHCCGLNPVIGIPVLTEKSLITIRNQQIQMHEMLQQLGKNIVREQYPEQPRLWSRLWLYSDFHHVMTTKMETNNVEAIVLDQKEDDSKHNHLTVEELSKMRSLRLLILRQDNFSGSLSFLSNSLHYLLWNNYPFTSLPPDFQPDKLVELNMHNSNIKRLWEGIKYFPCLKRVDLRDSVYLSETPNFEWIPKLERLYLAGCTSLSQVHQSIGRLAKLTCLSLRGCTSLVSLDFGSEPNLSSLRVLDLHGCRQLENMPDFIGLSNLEYLDFEDCASLSTVDESIGVLLKLKFLRLSYCTNLVGVPSSINTLTSLKTLGLTSCFNLMNLPLGQRSELEEPIYLGIFRYMPSSCLESLISLDIGFCNLREVPDTIGELRCLERLNLEGNKFVSLPNTITRLSSLAYLNLAHCHELQSLPDLPLSSASSVGRYFKTESESRNHRSGLYIFDCLKLVDGYDVLDLMFKLQQLALMWLVRLVQQPSHFRCGFDIVIPGDVIPEWFNHQFNQSSKIRIVDNQPTQSPNKEKISIVDSDVDDNWIGFAFCVAFEVLWPRFGIYLSFESEDTEERFDVPLSDYSEIGRSKHLWLIYISRQHCHFVTTRAKITFKAGPGSKIKEWGLRRVFKQNIEALKRELSWFFDLDLDPQRLNTSEEDNQVDHLPFEHVDESSSSGSFRPPDIQLPYNWLVTEEEENEKMEAEDKELMSLVYAP